MEENNASLEVNIPKRKNKKIIILIIALTVLVVMAAIVGGSFFVNKDISGAWLLVVNPELPVATADEIPESERVYYIFEKPDRYGKGNCNLCYQGAMEKLTFQLSEENKTQKINLGVEDMEYVITGSKLLGNAKLTIIYPEYTDANTAVTYEAQKYIFKQAKNPMYENQSYKDYETDKKLLEEKWTSKERSLSYFHYSIPYVETIKFKDNGVMIIHYESDELLLDRYMFYAYTAKNNQLTFSLVTDKETKYAISYKMDEKGNLKFENDTTSASIFADEFFGDFTFYAEKNLPQPTTASAK